MKSKAFFTMNLSWVIWNRIKLPNIMCNFCQISLLMVNKWHHNRLNPQVQHCTMKAYPVFRQILFYHVMKHPLCVNIGVHPWTFIGLGQGCWEAKLHFLPDWQKEYSLYCMRNCHCGWLTIRFSLGQAVPVTLPHSRFPLRLLTINDINERSLKECRSIPSFLSSLAHPGAKDNVLKEDSRP